MIKRYQINVIREKRSYSVKDAAEALGVHVRTIQSWIKSGLRPLSSRPYLIMGSELKSFLAAEAQKQKHQLGPGEFYCFHCHKAVAGSQVESISRGNTMGHDKLAIILKGVCVICGGKVNRFSVVPRPSVATFISTHRATLSGYGSSLLITDKEITDHEPTNDAG